MEVVKRSSCFDYTYTPFLKSFCDCLLHIKLSIRMSVMQGPLWCDLNLMFQPIPSRFPMYNQLV